VLRFPPTGKVDRVFGLTKNCWSNFLLVLRLTFDSANLHVDMIKCALHQVLLYSYLITYLAKLFYLHNNYITFLTVFILTQGYCCHAMQIFNYLHYSNDVGLLA
jgi:hypothetical protein